MKVTRSIPMYRQIAAQLRQDVFCRCLPGDELPGDNQLAKQLNISSLTVREAMAVLGEEGLVDRKVGSGTRVGRPRIGKNQVVAVLIDKDLAHPQFPTHVLATFEGIRRAFGRMGIRAQLYTGDAEPNCFPEHISSKHFIADLTEGRLVAVVSLVAYPEQQYLDFAATRHIPWVYFGRTGNAPIKIMPDMEGILDALVAQFAEQGKRRIALLGWRGFWDTNLRCSERRRWFEAATARHGMSTREEWIRMDLYPGLMGAGWSQIRTLWTSDKEKPDAVVFLDDLLFVDALPALTRLGLNIPNDLAIGVMTLRAEQLPTQTGATIAAICPKELSRIACEHVMVALESGVVPVTEQILAANIIQLAGDGAEDSSEDTKQLTY